MSEEKKNKGGRPARQLTGLAVMLQNVSTAGAKLDRINADRDAALARFAKEEAQVLDALSPEEQALLETATKAVKKKPAAALPAEQPAAPAPAQAQASPQPKPALAGPKPNGKPSGAHAQA